MNRKQKIIVSVVGIFIVLLVLVGLTYAYFLTQIKGNTNDKSITVTTAKLELIYGDGNGVLTPASKIKPGDKVKFLDKDGNTVESKTFTVTNNGNATVDDYGVVLENFSVIYYSDEVTEDENGNEVIIPAGTVTEFSRPEDFEFVITCKNQDGEECTGYNGTLPTQSEILIRNSIEKDEVQTYTATLTYKEAGVDQSADMNKTISGKFNIIGIGDTVDLTGEVTNYESGDYVQTNSTKRVSAIYPDGTYKVLGLEAGEHKIKVCAYNENEEIQDCTDEEAKMIQTLTINKGDTSSVDNTSKTITITESSRLATVDINLTNSTINLGSSIVEETRALLNETIINRAKSITESDSKALGYAMYSDTLRTTPGQQISEADESLLLTTEDDYGISYYYRGNVTNNFVNYSGMCWRILRIQGNGTIKLVLYDENNECTDNPTNSPSTWINNATSYVYNTVDTTVDSSLWPQSLKYESSNIPSILEAWMNDKNFDTSKLTNTDFCNDMSPTTLDNGQITYGALNRLYPTSTASPSLVCSRDEDKVNTSIALLTADEVAFASGMEGYNGTVDNGYLADTSLPMGNEPPVTFYLYWTMSPAFYDENMYVESLNTPWMDGGPMMYQVNVYSDTDDNQRLLGYNHSVGILYENPIRPVIVLKRNVILSTSTTSTQIGTQTSPYVID